MRKCPKCNKWTLEFDDYFGRYRCFNPDCEFWAHKQLLPKDNCDVVITTYLDNEMCPSNEVDYIESRRSNTEWFKVYGLGQTGTYSDRRIYTFRIEDKVPLHAKKIPRGMDFGSSPDPTTLVDLYIDGIDLYIDEIFTEKNLMPEKIQGAEKLSIVDRMNRIALLEAKNHLPKEYFLEFDDYYYDFEPKNDKERDILARIRAFKNWLICCDSSGANEIRDLRRHGYNVRGIGRPKGSLIDGINRMRSYNIIFTKRSINAIEGAQGWFRKVNREGVITSEPDGHEPDPLTVRREKRMVWPVV